MKSTRTNTTKALNAVSICPASSDNVDPSTPGRPNARGEEFTGISNEESYDDACQDAVDQAQRKLGGGGADALIGVEVLSVEGERGGIDGRRKLMIKILAWVK